jgi:hypothetical protein
MLLAPPLLGLVVQINTFVKNAKNIVIGFREVKQFKV